MSKFTVRVPVTFFDHEYREEVKGRVDVIVTSDNMTAAGEALGQALGLLVAMTPVKEGSNSEETVRLRQEVADLRESLRVASARSDIFQKAGATADAEPSRYRRQIADLQENGEYHATRVPELYKECRARARQAQELRVCKEEKEPLQHVIDRLNGALDQSYQAFADCEHKRVELAAVIKDHEATIHRLGKRCTELSVVANTVMQARIVDPTVKSHHCLRCGHVAHRPF